MTTTIAETIETIVLPTAETVKPASVKEVLTYLVAQYPSCFAADDQVKPLKVGIFQDLAVRLADDNTVSKTQLRQALRVYTSSWRYLEATKEGVSRVDLDGQPAETIDASQAEHAAKLLAESKQKAAEKRKVRIQEQRARQQSEKAAVVTTGKKKPNKTFNKGSKTENAAAKPVKGQQPAARDAVLATVPVKPELISVAPTQLQVGSKVLVKLGLTPMPATVQEVSLPEVTVQLDSGMVIKTRQDSLYQA